MVGSHELHIHDGNWTQHVSPNVNGQKMSRGLKPRDYSAYPRGCYTSVGALDIPLIPRDQWVDRIKEKEANKARTSDIRRSSGPNGGPIPSLDQDGVGYCWNHSVTMALILKRALQGLPYVRLSAFFIGCLVKNYRDEGGWGADGLDFAMKNGIPDISHWPEKSMDRYNDNQACRQNALLHRPTETAMDLSAPVYDRNLSEDQAMTLLLSNDPLISDFNWWSHSVCLMDAVIVSQATTNRLQDLDFNNINDLMVYATAFGKRGINSWTDSYGDMGEFVLSGSKAILDGGAAILVSTGSIA